MSLPQKFYTSSTPELVVEPTVAKAGEKSRQCPICHVYYKYGNSYWQHVRYVHARFLSQCVICEKSYKRTTMAKHHILHSHKIAWHLCCNYVRRIKKSDLPQQNQEVKNVKENKRNINSVRYFKKKTLHLISSFNCYDCPGSFATIDELFEHVKSHRGKENYISCDEIDDNDDTEDTEDTFSTVYDVNTKDAVNTIDAVNTVDDVNTVDAANTVDAVNTVDDVNTVDTINTADASDTAEVADTVNENIFNPLTNEDENDIVQSINSVDVVTEKHSDINDIG